MPPSTSRRQRLVEIVLIFAVLCVVGGWPAPDSNEPHYLGKAIHYWNPAGLPGDFFLESADTHKVFYFTFGWLSLWLGPGALIWTGRAATWILLAWAWRRLSFAIVPRAWYSVLTAALFACLMERCHMAGEWVIGGVEAKGFAYVFVLLAIESLVCNRWNRALLLLGAASAFHVLAGGWAAVAAGLAWVWLRRSRNRDSSAPPLRSLWPGILGGALLALPGMWPSLTLDWGADQATVRLAHQVYVFERLPHHLTLAGIRGDLILRFALLTVMWAVIGWIWRRLPAENATARAALHAPYSDASNQQDRLRRLRAFVGGAVLVTLVGVAIQPLVHVDRALAASLLRYYWFRLSDVAVPLGVALEGVALIRRLESPPTRLWSRGLLALAILIAVFHVGDRAIDRIAPAPPRSNRMRDFDAWHAACRWVAESGEIPAGARFITPRLAQTFRWYAGRSTVATWKDVPQDAEALVQWWSRVRDIYERPNRTSDKPRDRWRDSLEELDAAMLKELAAKYDADYAITDVTGSPLPLEVVHREGPYVIYRLRR